MSVDGTDCRIYEPYPFNSAWFSHKFKGPGVRYEIALSIRSGRIIWAHGPFPCGAYPDVSIFEKGLAHQLEQNERVIADNGYKHPRCITRDSASKNHALSSLCSTIRARHETVNRRIKQFNILKSVFRHNVQLHSKVFHAVVRLTALMLDTSDPLFTISN